MQKIVAMRGSWVVALCASVVFVSGCASSGMAVTGTPAGGALDVTTLNGQPLPGRMARMAEESTMLDTVGADGRRIVIERGVRKAGTRAAIHIHAHGGTTCVLTGEATIFMEGSPPSKWSAGTCYYMPPHTLMAAANLGSVDAVLMDIFTLPPGVPTISIREPGYPAHP